MRELAPTHPRTGYVLWSEDWHPGVVGIVASRIVERYHRPAVLVALDGESGSGSGRSIPGFDLLGALHAGAAHLRRYGGHRAAAGLTIDVGAARGLPRRVRGARRGGAHARPARAASSASTPSSPGTSWGWIWPRSSRRSSRAAWATRRRGCSSRGAASTTCGRWERAAMRGSRSSPGACAPARSPSAATAASPTTPRSRWTRPSGSSATPGTARSSPGSCCATPSRARRLRSSLSAPLGQTAICRRCWPRSTRCSIACRRRRLPTGARRAGPARWSTAAGTAPWRCSWTRWPAAGPVLALCADVSRRLPGLRERVGGFTLAAYGELERRPGRGARLRARRRAGSAHRRCR